MPKVQWLRTPEQKGQFLFTFDGKRIYNLFRDCPHALTDEEKEIFDAENPYWCEFFRDKDKGEI